MYTIYEMCVYSGFYKNESTKTLNRYPETGLNQVFFLPKFDETNVL